MRKITTSFVKEKTERHWHIIDLAGQPIGRVASEIAKILRGKNKAIFTPHQDVGDFVVAVNASKLRLTGNKWLDKVYYHHSGYIGGLKAFRAEELLKRKPEELIYRAVKGMLPKTFLGKKQLRKLKIYAGAEHPHAAQQLQVLTVKVKKHS